MISSISSSNYRDINLKVNITPENIIWYSTPNLTYDIELGSVNFKPIIKTKSSCLTVVYNVIPPPTNVQEMIDHINRVLHFTTLSEINIENGSLEEVIALLYMVPLEYNVIMVDIGMCESHKKERHINRIKKFTILDDEIITYGDVLKYITLKTDNYPESELFEHDKKNIYFTPELLINNLKKRNFKVNENQIKKHMYEFCTSEFPYPHYYGYQMTGILTELELMDKLPLVYENCNHNIGNKPDIILNPDKIYLKTEYLL